MREEIFARSLPPTALARPVGLDARDDTRVTGDAKAIIKAIREGDINNVRELTRIIREYERDSYDPTTETVGTT